MIFYIIIQVMTEELTALSIENSRISSIERNNMMKHNQQRILVYGATGVQGRPVARRLLQAGHNVRILVRNPAKADALRQAGAEIAIGDLSDPASLQAANQGIDAVFLHLPLEFDKAVGVRYGRNAIDAAKAAGVSHLVFSTSGQMPDSLTEIAAFEFKRDIQTYLQQSGVPSIILRPTLYMENFAGPWTAPGIVQQGIVAYPLPSRFKQAWISVDDVAALAVAALQRPELAGSSFDVGGPEVLDGDAIAERFATVFKRPVHYYPIPLDAFEQQLNAALGAPAGTEVTQTYRWVEANLETHSPIADMQSVLQQLPVELTSLEAWIRQQDWSAWAQPNGHKGS
jgi:NAD(P)H dehydrogenase (quinone)